MQKIIIDTDPGQDIDDLLAIWFALRRPELDVKAITTVTYPATKRARLVKRLLRYLDRTDIPVSAGMELPLRPFSADELKQSNMARSMNHYSFAEPEDPRDDPGDDDAVSLIIRTIEQHPGEIVLACIAPLTNIACALRKRPEIAGKIKYIAMMGGEITQDRTEHNVAFDYNASEIVLSSGIPIFMGTWDITRRFSLTMGECTELFSKHSAPVTQALAQAIVDWHPAQNWKPGPVMYDLFPMVWAFDRSFYTTEPMSIQVETRNEAAVGKTLVRGQVPAIEVTTGIRTEELRELYLQSVLA